MSCHLCLFSIPEPQLMPSLWTPASATCSALCSSFSPLPLEDNTFFSRFSVTAEVEREQKWEFRCECAEWILDKRAFGSVGWLLLGLHMKDCYSTPEKTWFSGQGLTCSRQYIHNAYCFWTANCFRDLGIITITKRNYIVKKKLLKCDSVQLLNVDTLPCLSPCLW